MIKIIKRTFYLLAIVTLVSCGTNQKTIIESDVNTESNRKYHKSRKGYSGKLNNPEYQEMKGQIERELNETIPEGKSILINYEQRAPNCISLSYNDEEFSRITDKKIQFSESISSDNNAVDFFVYTNDSFHKDLHQERKEFILDSGFFYNEVFTKHKHCSAFLILKPNGTYLKFYGEDYYSQVEEFLEKE